MTKKLIYPAIFHHEDNAFWVDFPDLEGCQSFGDNVEEAFQMAKEALTAYCASILEQGKALPPPTQIEQMPHIPHSFPSLIEASF
ncbi:MAG: type II toxin-antitoxin system HicB family antitoxin [Oscillospiraceae bacterium]